MFATTSHDSAKKVSTLADTDKIAIVSSDGSEKVMTIADLKTYLEAELAFTPI